MNSTPHANPEPEPVPHEQPEPWDRRPDETRINYEAFLAFRDLGQARTVAASFRNYQASRPRRSRITGELLATRKPGMRVYGNWYRWYRAFDWQARAEAYDRSVLRKHESVMAQAIANAQVQTGIDWIERQSDLYRQAYEDGRHVMRQGMVLASFPAVTRTISQDGLTHIYKASDPAELLMGARMAAIGQEMCARACVGAMNILNAGSGQQAPVASERDRIAQEAERRILETRRRLEAGLIEWPDEPPERHQMAISLSTGDDSGSSDVSEAS